MNHIITNELINGATKIPKTKALDNLNAGRRILNKGQIIFAGFNILTIHWEYNHEGTYDNLEQLKGSYRDICNFDDVNMKFDYFTGYSNKFPEI